VRLECELSYIHLPLDTSENGTKLLETNETRKVPSMAYPPRDACKFTVTHYISCQDIPEGFDPELYEENPWHWCDIRVKCRIDLAVEIDGSAWIHGCSYASENHFRSSVYQLDGMKEAAYKNLCVTIDAVRLAIGQPDKPSRKKNPATT